MPLKNFICPDDKKISIKKCLAPKGCRMDQRCATLPYLRQISHEREWKGKISPSRAGVGPRKIWLEQVVDYAASPEGRVWASMGTVTHDKLSHYKYTDNVLSEEPLSDNDMSGIADVLEMDEENDGRYILFDYKTSGSFQLTKWLGIYQKDVPVLDENGETVLVKTGKNKGTPKTKKEITYDTSKIDIKKEEYQLNRYRIFFEMNGYPISKMFIQAIPRDGGTYIAQSRGISRNLYMIPVRILPDKEVLGYYETLQKEVDNAFLASYARKCNDWESWGKNRCCEKYCEVFEACQQVGI